MSLQPSHRRDPQEPYRFTGSYVHDRFPDATDCCMAVAFKGASWTDPDSIPLMVMQTMLGEWRRDGLFQRRGVGESAVIEDRRPCMTVLARDLKP